MQPAGGKKSAVQRRADRTVIHNLTDSLQLACSVQHSALPTGPFTPFYAEGNSAQINQPGQIDDGLEPTGNGLKVPLRAK